MKPIPATVSAAAASASVMTAVPASPRRTRKLQQHHHSNRSSSNENYVNSSSPPLPLPNRFSKSSKSVPIVKRMKRTPSELQLLEDESVADYRDYCMYSRIMNGMNRQNHHHRQHHQQQQHQASSHKVMYSIMRTRNQPIQERFHSYDEDFLKYALDVTAIPDGMAIKSNATATNTAMNDISNDDYGFHATLHEEEEGEDPAAATTTGLIIREPEDEQHDKPTEEEPSSHDEEGVFMLDL